MANSSLHEPPPVLEHDRVQQILRQHYFPDCSNADLQLHALDSERDQNIRVETPHGTYVLKIANPAEAEAQLACQNAVLERLGADMSVPRVIPSINKRLLVSQPCGEEECFLRLVTWLPGQQLHQVVRDAGLLTDLGRFLGRLDHALAGFMHPGAIRRFIWDLKCAGDIAALLEHIDKLETRRLVQHFLQRFAHIRPELDRLPGSVIHNDANDHNVLAEKGRVSGLIDFGDLVYTARICELAIGLAYALMDAEDLMQSARAMIAGYHAELPLEAEELAVLFDLVGMRLCTSIAVSSWRSKNHPNNDYLLVSQSRGLALLKRWRAINPQVAHFNFRAACGFEPSPDAPRIASYLQSRGSPSGDGFRNILPLSVRLANKRILSYQADSPALEEERRAESLERYAESLFARLKHDRVDLLIGRYLEDRAVYSSHRFHVAESAESRSVHTGMDLFMPAATEVFTPLDGVVVSIQNNAELQDYGPTLILEHRSNENLPFYTLYGHLSMDTLDRLQPGQKVSAGDLIGWLGTSGENGGWVPHLHFQVMTDLLGLSGNFPGVCTPNQVDVWRSICIDPNLILGMTPETFEEDEVADEELLKRRLELLGPSLSLSYQHPIRVVRGEGCYLFDQFGRGYLDCVNNISHVGHCHPHVVQALRDQAAVLNTNTRYLHDGLIDYAARLTALLPEPLNVCFFVCTGSEANELALRLAETATGRRQVLAVDAAYHGNTRGLIDLSAYKHAGPGGKGPGQEVTVLPLPDVYRGEFRTGESRDPGLRYARQAGEIIQQRVAEGSPPGAFIAESLPGCGGQIVFPEGYLNAVYRQVRESGGLCIADEVQVGFGRVGEAFWGFELQGVVPDIVTLGKPIGNGHPLAAVITTREIASAFANGMEYFNSFGGNPVSCAVGMAVLDVIESEGLQQKALTTGNYLLEQLDALKRKFPLIGDVRGRGLYLGIELVKRRDTREPAAEEARNIVNEMRERGILLSTDGPLHNVLKIKPPMLFSIENANTLCRELGDVLAMVGVKPGDRVRS